MVTNGRKWQKIANNCKISEITKYGEKFTKMPNNVKKMPKTAQKRPNLILFSSFFWRETTSNKQVKQRSPLCDPLGSEINSQIYLKNINMAKND